MAMAQVLERPAAATANAFLGSCPDLAPRAAVRAGRGAPHAHGALLDVLVAHRAMLVNVARGFVGCASRAEDVVHDVFVKLVEFPNQDAVRQPVAYVTRMVRNASIDALRRQSFESIHHTDEDDGFDVPSPEPTPEAALMTRDALRRVCAALDDLPARSRAAFEMVRLREETLQTAARALNVSQTLVHFMVRDAERHCVECLDACHRGVECPVFLGGRARRR
ncbi:TPA: RNA polymerase factor sigma-70 [Burkholderia vietnamiensis]|uniref:RNA polymerase factor sigma-70 n=1 Tax=Burkholderia vietnamiensis TaxID=60552 RepID=UPI0015946596|nr:RNA polymerase factor sigma-70 [Burkholderia vietnamiensis]MBR7908907.1 RNA polymerase factor sigma-70 [Burkholderia vietnamiensis]MCA7945034.1 RNA polymerase factor sigma-70 [Burkholderia vietnamiensis]HDR8970514.1 RNA polymerase factor sigma-70 [Burkholderia vietnamiensis]HDR9143624.1 RNA polymerase factor sigma-70 [Burkholderia vietnamiensis]HDR9219840.1 RNA polymerase factor sigma-70 [Burkholderia vietnamiensis]